MFRLISAAAAALMVVSAPGLAVHARQSPPPGTGETVVEGVTVTGRRMEEAVRAFVAEVAATPRDRNLARWDRRVCVGVVNMAPRYAQGLIDHISAVSLSIGLDIGDPGCRPNVLILADSSGDALAAHLVSRDPQIFRPDIGNSNLGRAALQRFQTSGAPVRWWHVTQTVSTDTGEVATGGASIQVRGASRLRSNIREDMNHVIVILDASQIGAVGFSSLADYVAMVALAQIDAEADTAPYETILNLFGSENADRNARMTQWDFDYLHGLYTARGDASDPRRQQREITQEILNNQEDRSQGVEAEAPLQD